MTNYKIHLLNYHSTKEKRKKEYTYYCESNNFGSFCENQINKHKETSKHKLIFYIINKCLQLLNEKGVFL